MKPKLPPPCFALFDSELLETGTGRVVLRFSAKPEHENPYGAVQGGLLAAMLDNCIGPAVFTIAPTRQSSTVEMTINYLAAVKAGETLRGEATVLHHGRTTAYVEASLHRSDGTLVARASATNVFLGEVEATATELVPKSAGG